MKILVFTDVHGGLNSLMTLKETKDFQTADKIIFLGDVMFGGSRPNECIQFLKDNNIECILGNNDSYVTDHIPECDIYQFKGDKGGQLNWMKNELNEDNKKFINSWTKYITLNLNGKKFFFAHYPWEEKDNDFSVVRIPENINIHSRTDMFKGIDADYYIFGHEHISSYLTSDNKHYYCLDSLSLKSPGSYLIIENNYNNIELIEKYINFNIQEERRLIEEAGYPHRKFKSSTSI